VLEALGSPTDESAWGEVIQRIGALAAELATLPDLERHEWLRMFSDRLNGLGDDCIGGAGGGVQLLTTTEARARTFDHLFLVGFNRGVFPRVVGDDSMLPDAVRSRLALDVLPEMPVRARSAEEERYLFAQLLSAAPRVHVSWHLAAHGSVMARSPFVADLMREGSPDPVAPPVWSSVRADLGPRPPYEHAVLAAGRGPRKELPPAMAAALADGGMAEAGVDVLELAQSRADILEQVDPEKRQQGPNPWFGFIGGAFLIAENGPSVTQVESFAECPLANFVTRRLDVAPMPDPQLGLPDPKGRLVGEVVHRVLEDVVREGLEGASGLDLDEAAALEPRAVPWPDPKRFEEILTHASHRVAAEAGLAPLGMSGLLAARSRPYIEVARRTEWGSDDRLEAVLATEVSGAAQLEGFEWPIRFRADRVDLGDGGLVLTDYKTGKPVSDKQQAKTRRKDLLKEVEKGRMLQAAAYAAASTSGEASGRYLWLKPDLGEAKEEVRWALVRGSETDFIEALAEAAAVVGRARHEGAVFPRVEEVGKSDKPDHCTYCPVAEVCRRDDSAFRRRLVEWMANEDPGAGAAETAARKLWRLGVPMKDER
jgi:RecB family exonuclease